MVHKEKRLCKCGCGKEIVIKSHHKYYGIPEYIHGHNFIGCKHTDDVKEKIGNGNRGKKRTDKVKREKSESMIEYHLEHPEMGKRQSKTMSGDGAPMKNSLIVKKQSESMKKSDAVKMEAERQCGGHDIVNHHMIYDHSDLSKHTMKMSRSIHSKLHALFRKYSIEIPHINNGE